ncbi:MAG: lysylphosphatidylglycerol synthase transmembrane domain-containing protein [Pseudomonadota bacterium]
MKYLKLLLKLSITCVVLWFVWSHVNLSQIQSILTNPWLLSVIPICWIINQLFTSLRLYSIVKALGRPVHLFDVIQANLGSLFIANLMPGVVGGDVIKYFYLKKNDPSISKVQLVLILMLDRILGLFAVLFWCSIFSFFIDVKAVHSQLSYLNLLTYMPFVMFIFVLCFFLLFNTFMKFFSKYNFPPMIRNLIEVYEHFVKSANWRSLLLVMSYNFFAVFILLLGLVLVGGYLEYQQIGAPMICFQFFLIPLVLIAAMLPITPMGIGVAQITMAAAYELYGLTPSVGVSVSTLSQLGLLFVSVFVGGVFFLLGDTRKAIKAELGSSGQTS